MFLIFTAMPSKILIFAMPFLFAGLSTFSQPEAIVHEGEIGISLGSSHYFGDLNNRSALDLPQVSFGVFFKKQFGNYVALKVSAHQTTLGYSDVLNSNRAPVQAIRNLSFATNLTEVAVQGDFNFFKYLPGNAAYPFTPYVTMGVGVFHFNPWTKLGGNKYYLQPLGTEGQGSNPYSLWSICLPFGMGIKYNIYKNINLSAEVSYRYTTTDYLDDVSKTYPDLTALSPLAAQLSDRSYPAYGKLGIQRGFSEQTDQYIIAEVGLSFSINSYKCAYRQKP